MGWPVVHRTPAWRWLWALLTVLDRILILTLLILGGGSVVLLGAFRTEGEVVVIEGEQGMVVKVSMDVVDTVKVHGPLGITQIVIGPEGARVVASPCSEQICVRTGAILRRGDLIACVPNRVVIRIPGAPEGSVDAIVR